MRGYSAAYGLLIAILLGAGLGYGLDVLTHHSPLGLLAGTFLGFATGLYSLYQAMMADSGGKRPEPPDQPPSDAP